MATLNTLEELREACREIRSVFKGYPREAESIRRLAVEIKSTIEAIEPLIQEMTSEVDGHYYLYRYDAGEETFYRATVPAGAAAPHFDPLKPTEKVPIGGWYMVAKKSRAPFRLRLVG